MDLLGDNSDDSLLKRFASSMADVRGYDYERATKNTGQDELIDPIVMLVIFIVGLCLIISCCVLIVFSVIKNTDGEDEGYDNKNDAFRSSNSNYNYGYG